MTVTSDRTCLILLRDQPNRTIPKLSMGMAGLGNRGGVVIIMIALLVKRISAYDGRKLIQSF